MAAVITYQYPVAGLVAPTALQVADQVTAVVEALDADTDAVVIHNLGLTAAQLLLGWPIVTLEPLYAVGGTEAILADWYVRLKTANDITITKVAVGGSGTGVGPTVRVHIQRPHSIGR
jgi:hypothetical protein